MMQSRASCQACTASGQLPKCAHTSPSSLVASTCATMLCFPYSLQLQHDMHSNMLGLQHEHVRRCSRWFLGLGSIVCCVFQDENARERAEAACLKSLFSGGAQLINDLDVLCGQSHFCWLRRSAHASPADENEQLDRMQTGQKNKQVQKAHSEHSSNSIPATHLHLACLPRQQQDTAQAPSQLGQCTTVHEVSHTRLQFEPCLAPMLSLTKHGTGDATPRWVYLLALVLAVA